MLLLGDEIMRRNFSLTRAYGSLGNGKQQLWRVKVRMWNLIDVIIVSVHCPGLFLNVH
jgi:hypothetical protein